MNNIVSIVVPTYERSPEFLKRALLSLYNQTYNYIEVIVVDDNHPESIYRKEIEEFIREFKVTHELIYIKNEKNLGGSLARNKGIDVAIGEFVTFLDDDDEYEIEKIERQTKFMVENDLDMSFTNLKILDHNNKIVNFRKFDVTNSFNNEDYLKYHLLYHLTGTPTFMYKTRAIKRIGGFEKAKIGQEFFLMLRTIEADFKIGYLKRCDVIAYRHNEGGISYGKNKIEGENELYLFKKKYSYLMNEKEIRYIDFRHHVVLAIAYKRNREFLKFIQKSLMILLNYPNNVTIELIKYISALRYGKKGGITT